MIRHDHDHDKKVKQKDKHEKLPGKCDVDTGITGEPRFDDEQFHSAVNGETLRVLVLEQRDLFDAPNIILVLDPAQSRAFAGTMGGFIRPDTNPFHGFYGDARIEQPSDRDREAVRFENDVPVSASTGEPLALVGQETPPPNVRDGLSAAWYFDREKYTVYKFVSGGIAGFRNHLDSVVRAPRLDQSTAH